MPVDSFNPYSRRAATFQSGFGLVELIVTIAIVAVLAALALPSYQQTIKNNRSATEANAVSTGHAGETPFSSGPIARHVGVLPSGDGTSVLIP